MRLLFYTLFIALFFTACQSSEPKEASDNQLTSSSKEGVEEVVFESLDGLEITADFYYGASKDKVVLLCHQAGFSRGAYNEIAPRLVAQGLSCMAVDLRSGGEVNGVLNETHARATAQGLSTNYQDSEQDIRAALDYLKSQGFKKVVLWGSSYSATLALMVGKSHPMVVKVVAISPGIYFGTENRLKRALTEFYKPAFVSCGKNEEQTARQLVYVIQEPYLKFVLPETSGDHGSKMFWQRSPQIDKLFNQIVEFI